VTQKGMIEICFSIITLLIFILISMIFIGKKQKNALLNRLQIMIEDAIEGTFLESHLTESKVSELESSMWRFLNDCQVSSLRLQEQKQQIQTLISDISHQTVMPISNIMIYVELLEEQLNEYKKENRTVDEDMAEEISSIKFQTDKLDFLISSLVKLSRLENGIMSLNPQVNSIQEVLDALEIQFAKKAQQKKISLLVEASMEKAEFDSKWTLEAIANIVDNAIKYTPEGGQVKIQVIPYSLFLRVDVTDNGIGIAESEIGKIFTRFYRSTAVCKQPGVGIGLYLSREVLKMQKGYIKVASKIGEGSTFSVFLYRG
jgi:signal transduction histidine kinase